MAEMNQDILQKEEQFHDSWAETIDVDNLPVDEFFEACTAPENRWLLEKLGDLTGRKVLELGCGAGEASIYLAKKGADVTATDLSGGMLKVVERLAKKHDVSVKTHKTDADQIDFPDGTFDIVYAANLLHHVDIGKTLDEACRVLKPGGIFCSWDPIAHNPAINVYRRIATEVRTEDEHPLRMKDLKLFSKHFSKVEYATFWFFTLWIFIRFYFIERVDPNKERYWKKIITEHQKLEPRYNRLERLDRRFFRLFPFLRRYAWNIAVIATKG